MTASLRHGAFRRLAAIYTGNCVAEWFESVALMVLVYAATQSAAAATAMLLCKQVLPGALIAAAGSSLDRLDLRRVMVTALVIQVAALAVLGLFGYGAWLYPVVAVLGFAGAAFRSALRAGVARTLSGESFRSANAMLNVVSSVAMAAGPALAAVAVIVLGATASVLFAAVICALFVPIAMGVRIPSADAMALRDDEADEVITVGRRTADPSLPLPLVLGLAGIVMCVVAMDEPALLAYAEESLGAGVGGYGAIYAAWGVGLAIGSVLFAHLVAVPMLRVASWATVLGAVGYIGLGVAPVIEVAVVVAVVGGVGNGMGWVALMTAVQEAAEAGEEARASARLESLTLVCPGIGILLGGLLADAADPRISLLLPGVLALAVVAFGALYLRVGLAARVQGARPGLLASSTPGGSA